MAVSDNKKLTKAERPDEAVDLIKVPHRRHRRIAVLIGIVGMSLFTWIVWMSFMHGRDWLASVGILSHSSSSSDRLGRRSTLPPEVSFSAGGDAQLGEFDVQLFNTATGNRVQAGFQLEGRTVCADEDAFEKFMAGNHRFFREQVIVTIRNSSAADLADSDLELLEKKLVARVNRALGGRFLLSANVKGLSLMETIAEDAQVEWKPRTPE